MTASSRLVLVCFFAAFAIGCDSGLRPEETISVNRTDPYAQVRSTLDAYANGQPLGSEVTSFDYMVNEVRKVDPAKADVLKAGLDDIAKGGPPAAKAKALKEKLGL